MRTVPEIDEMYFIADLLMNKHEFVHKKPEGRVPQASVNAKELLTEYIDGFEPVTNEPTYTGLDLEVLHCVVNKYDPYVIVEVGAGSSTKVIANAMPLTADFYSVDKEKMPTLYNITHIHDRIQAAVVRLPSCKDWEMLFIDGSHSFDEALWWQKMVFPYLRVGTIVHLHDICIDKFWQHDDRFTGHFEEEDVFCNWWIENGKDWEYMLHTGIELEGVSEQELRTITDRDVKPPYGASFWMRKVK